MKINKFIIVLVLLMSTTATLAQSTEFTFQGNLREGASDATGNYDFEFALFAIGGAQLGNTITRSNVPVSNGSFAVTLDFGDQFGGAGRTIEVRVRPSGGGAFATLSPRQPINSTPYSIRSLTAGDAATADNFRGSLAGDVTGPQTATSIANSAVTAAKLGDGSVTNPKLADGSVTVAKLGDGSVTVAKLGDGSVNVAKLGDGSVTNPKLADGSVTVAKLGDGSVNVAKLGDGSVTNPKLANSSISSLKIAAGQVVKSINGLTDGITFVAGPNITITPDANTITFAGTGGSGNAILNQTTLQPSSNFNISGNGTAAGTFSANIVSATTQFNRGADRLLAATGTTNLFVGIGAGTANTGFDNTFVGRGAGQTNSGGNTNSFFGTSAGLSTISGSANSFFGRTAGMANTFGNSNVFFGVGTGIANTTGNANSFVGTGSGSANTTGDFNVFIGTGAGDVNTTGNLNTLIGYNAETSGPNLTYATAIGADSVVTLSNTVVLGRAADTVRAPGNLAVGGTLTTNGTFAVLGTSTLAGVVDLGTLGAAGSQSICRNASGQISTCSSSLRYKTNFSSFRPGLDLIKQLQPLTFDWKDGGMHDLGLSAEDVAAIEPLLVTNNTKGEVEGVKYDRIGVVLINAVKEQQKQIEEQNETIVRQRVEIAAMKSYFCGMKTKPAFCANK